MAIQRIRFHSRLHSRLKVSKLECTMGSGGIVTKVDTEEMSCSHYVALQKGL